MENSATVQQVGFAVHKPKMKKTIRKGAYSKGDETESVRHRTNKAALEHFQEPLETALIRHLLYQEHLIRFQSKVNNFEQTELDELTEQVVTFVKEQIDLSKSMSRQDENTDLPIGVIVTEEFRDLMSTVIGELQKSIEFLLVRVSSNKCPNIKSTFQNIAKELIHSNPNVSRVVDETRMDDPDELEDSMAVEVFSRRKRHRLSIYDVNSWYKSGKAKPYVIIVLDDIDLFPDNVGSELLLLLSCLRINFMILLGVSSQFVSADDFIPDHSIVKEFMVPEEPDTGNPEPGTMNPDAMEGLDKFMDPVERLDKFMDLVLFNWNNPFRLSGGIVRLFRNYFLDHSFSISRLLQTYQMCLMEHFRKPESLFCHWDMSSLWESQQFLELGPEEFLASLEPVPGASEIHGLADKNRSCRSSAKSPTKKRRLVLNDIEDTKKYTLQKLKQCYHEIMEWYESFLVLYQIGQGLPEDPIGKTKLESYISASTGSIYQEHPDGGGASPFEKLLKTVHTFSSIEMEKRLTKALDEIKDFHKRNASSKLVEFSMDKGIPEAVGNLILSIQKAKSEDMAAQEASALLDKEPAVVVATNYPKRKSIRAKGYGQSFEQLQSKLMKNIDKTKKEKCPAFTKRREDVIGFLKGSIRSKLKNLREIPFAQVFVFDDVEFVRKQLFPNLPKELHLALSLPQNYLHCDCCEDTHLGDNHSSLPDTSILYKLLLGSVYHVLDLNDLFIAFKSVHEPAEPKLRTPSARKKAKEEEQQFLSRFSKSYAELQFLGLVKRNKRKPDEATKLSWIFSNC